MCMPTVGYISSKCVVSLMCCSWIHVENRSSRGSKWEFTCDTRRHTHTHTTVSFSKSPILVFLLSNPHTACSLANGPMRVESEGQKKSAPLPTLRGPLFSLSLSMSFSSQTHPLVSLTQKTARTKKKRKKRNRTLVGSVQDKEAQNREYKQERRIRE